MRKNIFYALAIIGFSNASFAADMIAKEKDLNKIIQFTENVEQITVEETKRPCTVYVRITNPDGSSGSIPGRGGSLTWDDCGKYKDKFLADLRESNVKFTDDDVSVNWG